MRSCVLSSMRRIVNCSVAGLTPGRRPGSRRQAVDVNKWGVYKCITRIKAEEEIWNKVCGRDQGEGRGARREEAGEAGRKGQGADVRRRRASLSGRCSAAHPRGPRSRSRSRILWPVAAMWRRPCCSGLVAAVVAAICCSGRARLRLAAVTPAPLICQ